MRFSLEESVWFQKGQEVDELISISLDPDITIQESDQYITIKGSLELTGEYNREPSFEVEEEDNTDYFHTNPRTIQSVEYRNEEGLCAFTHQFPVEVTIPKNRIQNLDDIDVAVETFDYAFPEKSCLRLTADLMIVGLYGEQQHELYEEEEEPVEIEVEEIKHDQPTFSDDFKEFDLYSKPSLPEIHTDDTYRPYQAERNNLEPVEEPAEEPFSYAKPEIPEENEEIYVPFEVEARKPPEEEQKVEEVVGFQSFEEKYPDITLGNDEEEDERKEASEKEPVLEKATAKEPEEVVPEITFITQEKMKAPVEESSSSEESSAEEEEVLHQEEKPAQEKKKKKKLKNKQSITLSEFFARKDDEEHTKVKMCIVQSGDTLENVAERYEVSVSQIQRVNQMELNQDIYEGQVLYIPIPQTQS